MVIIAGDGNVIVVVVVIVESLQVAQTLQKQQDTWK
jgi:hypothetical protein